jgi:hypothetical protein
MMRTWCSDQRPLSDPVDTNLAHSRSNSDQGPFAILLGRAWVREGFVCDQVFRPGDW